MISTRRFIASVLFSTVIASSLAGCKTRELNESSDVNDLRRPSTNLRDPDWIYNGPLPKLEGTINIFVSTLSHTARVTGFIPASFDLSKLPSHVHVDDIDGRKRLMVVYPVATVSFAKNPRGNSIGVHNGVVAFPYNPRGVGSHPETPWGGFPYIEYDSARSIAFHGPIESLDTDEFLFWRVQRGPVSNACNRMQGEHVTELAHMIGVNMLVPHSASESRSFPNVRVEVREAFDVIPDGSLKGKAVDVDYKPKAGVKRPTQNVQMFKTWSGLQNPTWVCQFRNARKNLGMQQCADLASTATPGQPPSQEPIPKPDARICKADKVNVRNKNLDIFSSAEVNEPVKRLGNRQTKDGNTFEEVFFTTEPTGRGFVAVQFLCDDVTP